MTLPLIFPPSSLPSFLAAGHGIDLGEDYANVPRGSGHTRKRPKATGAPRTVSVAWILDEAQMADLHDWFENALEVGVQFFTAMVANQGPGQLFWRAKWVAPYDSDPQPTPRGLMWTVTGSIRLFGDGEATRPSTGALAGEIEVDLDGSATLVLPDTPLAGEILVELIGATPLRGEIIVYLTSTITPLSGEIIVQLNGSGTISAGGGSDIGTGRDYILYDNYGRAALTSGGGAIFRTSGD